MKTCIKLILGGFFLFGLYSCANSKKTQEKAPVAVQHPFYTVAGTEETHAKSSLELFLPLDSQLQSSVELDSVYFRGRAAKLERLSEDSDILVGRFDVQASRNQNEDRIMSSDPRDEYGNKPPVVLPDVAFDLERNQAVVSYQEEGKTKYFKILDIEERQVD